MAVFDCKFTIESRFKYNTVDSAWVPDPNRLTLICGSEIVGKCEFDIAQLIDVTPVVHKAIL